MGNPFKSILSGVVGLVKKIFTNPKVVEVAKDVNNVIVKADAEIIKASPLISLIPGFGAMIEAGANVVLQVEATAASVNAQEGTGTQKLAIALPQMEQIVLKYMNENNFTFKGEDSVVKITNYLVGIINEIGDKADQTQVGK